MAERAALEPLRAHRAGAAGVEHVQAGRFQARDLGVEILGQPGDMAEAGRTRELRRVRLVNLCELDDDLAPGREPGGVVVDRRAALVGHLVELDVLEHGERSGAEVAREALDPGGQVLDDVADVMDHRAATQRNVLTRRISPAPSWKRRSTGSTAARTAGSPAAWMARAPPAEHSSARAPSSRSRYFHVHCTSPRSCAWSPAARNAPSRSS